MVPRQAAIMVSTDKQTCQYFDAQSPSYDPERLSFCLPFLQERGDAATRLIDVGCGDGSTLRYVRENTPIRDLTGLDITDRYLQRAKARFGCRTILGSVLDPKLVADHHQQFDVCLLASVLHHLIGRTRGASSRLAQTAIDHVLHLVRPGGHLVLFEPCHGPIALMTAVFWIKKTVGTFTNRRLEIHAKWFNPGQPVVSYYTVQQVEAFCRHSKPARIIHKSISAPKKLFRIINREELGLIIEKL